jgi:hypothetical protein
VLSSISGSFASSASISLGISGSLSINMSKFLFLPSFGSQD